MVQKTENVTDYFQESQWCGWSPLTWRNKMVAWQKVHSGEAPAGGGGVRSQRAHVVLSQEWVRDMPCVTWAPLLQGTSVSTDFGMMRWSGIQNLNSLLLYVESTSLSVVLCSTLMVRAIAGTVWSVQHLSSWTAFGLNREWSLLWTHEWPRGFNQ